MRQRPQPTAPRGARWNTPPSGIVLTSDSFFYFAGQLILWAVLGWGAAGLLRTHLDLRRRMVLVAALLFAFLSSLAPLFLRWVISMPGLGGPDAGGEEFWFSFSATLPQAIAFALLLWLAVGPHRALSSDLVSSSRA